MGLRLFEYSVTRSFRCRWLLQELNVPFEAVTIDLSKDEQRSLKFLKLNPNGRVPVLDDEGFILFESGAICTYLADKYPERSLIPKVGSRDRALHDQWMYFCVTELEQPLWTITKHSRILPEEKRIASTIPLAQEEFQKVAKVVEDHLGDRSYMIGKSFSLVDIFIGQTLLWASWYKLLREFPRLSEYVSHLKSREAFPR